MDPALLARVRDPELIAERARAAELQRATDWPALGPYRRANAEVTGPVDVVLIGDSITEMWRIAQPDLFSGGVHNRGISGQTSPQILIRFMPDVVALKPRAVHLMCGVNDIAGNTGATTPRDYRNNILAMLDLAKAHGIAVILCSLTPFRTLSWAPEAEDAGPRVAELNRWLKAVSVERGLVHADYFPVLADSDGAMRAEFTRDGVHPGALGYQAMRPVADAAIAEALRA